MLRQRFRGFSFSFCAIAFCAIALLHCGPYRGGSASPLHAFQFMLPADQRLIYHLVIDEEMAVQGMSSTRMSTVNATLWRVKQGRNGVLQLASCFSDLEVGTPWNTIKDNTCFDVFTNSQGRLLRIDGLTLSTEPTAMFITSVLPLLPSSAVRVGEGFRLPFKLAFPMEGDGSRRVMRQVEGEMDCVLQEVEGPPGSEVAKLHCRYQTASNTQELEEEVTVDMEMTVSRTHGYVVENTVSLSFKEDYSNGLQVGLGVSIKANLQNEAELSFPQD